MVVRKSYLGPKPNHPSLEKVLEEAIGKYINDEQLREQRISFAYGNAPADSGITKESIRNASSSLRLRMLKEMKDENCKTIG